MQTISAEQFKKTYGTDAAAQFQPASSPQGRPSIGEVIANSFKSGINQVKQGAQQINHGTGNPLDLIEGFGNIGAGAIGAAFSPLSPVTEPTIGAAVKKTADAISNIPAVQHFADSPAGHVATRVAQDVGNYSAIAGTVGGALEAPAAVGAAANTTKTAISNAGEAAAKAVAPLKTAAGDIVPSIDRVVNHQVTQALDLTASDVKNISLATGNEVGKFLADRNLIGTNKETTVQNIQNFFNENYKAVRAEISNVEKAYKPEQVPRYTDALKSIKEQVTGVPGLEATTAEVDSLLSKPQLNLLDVQRVKELIDQHFNLYKATGDVKDGVVRQGLNNIRKDIRGFIEDQVKENTGADISGMNKNVQTAKDVLNAVEARSTAGLTRSNIQLSDLGTFGIGSGIGGPLVGAAALFAKKVIQSPSFRLRFAKYLDGISDAQKVKIQSALQAGTVPPELTTLSKD